jgi:hypothetical protein
VLATIAALPLAANLAGQVHVPEPDMALLATLAILALSRRRD